MRSSCHRHPSNSVCCAGVTAVGGLCQRSAWQAWCLGVLGLCKQEQACAHTTFGSLNSLGSLSCMCQLLVLQS